MTRRVLVVAVILMLFLIANRAAVEGYFSDDDLDNLSWATVAGIDSFAREIVTPEFSKTNTRPTGGLFYRWMGLGFGFAFERYVPPLFALHFLNCGLLFWLARRKGVGEWEATAACVFFLFHAALLEAWWKPMYIFDLLAATFCLVTWLLFGSRYWPWALLSFWLAYKSKEVALFFPVVLALDQWRRALPFFLISANFGIQAMLVNSKRESVYTLRFSPQSFVMTVPFYLKQAVLNKWGALILLPLAYVARNREFAKAVVGTMALMVPLLFLPGRLFGVYLYVPMLPLTLGLATVFSRVPRLVLSVGLAGFLLLDYGALKQKRKTELALGQESRAYVEQLVAAHHNTPIAATAYYENAPEGLRLHGMTGALRLVTGNPAAQVLDPELESSRLEAQDQDLPTLSWFRPTQTLTLISHRYGEAKLSRLDFGKSSAGWQLQQGWFDRDGLFRWASRRATLRLKGDAEARLLRVRYNNGPLLLSAVKELRVSVLLNGQEIGQSVFDQPGTPTVDYLLPRSFEGVIEVELRSSPGYRSQEFEQELGVAVFSVELLR